MTTPQFGLASAEEVTAAQQLQKSFSRAGIQPLPPGEGGRVKASGVGITDSESITFFVIGDHGDIKAPNPQNAVSYAMQSSPGPRPAFVYSVGDLVYFNGAASEYQPQFYEPYGHLATPIVAIPGNHDGDTTDDPARAPLDAFMANFCDQTPSVPAADPQFEFARHTQTQPYCDWTLECKAVTIVGVYSNVPSGGHLEQSQIDWLIGELKHAPTDRPLIVAVHHPPYSVDAHHGGSKHMGDALDHAFDAAERSADLVLSGHVHDAQSFTRVIGDKSVPYIVLGNSGYHNLHHLARDAQPGGEVAPGVTFEYADASEWGFLALTVSGDKIAGEYVSVTPGVKPDGSDAQVTPNKYRFST